VQRVSGAPQIRDRQELGIVMIPVLQRLTALRPGYAQWANSRHFVRATLQNGHMIGAYEVYA
jgi:hypothetical protein